MAVALPISFSGNIGGKQIKSCSFFSGIPAPGAFLSFKNRRNGRSRTSRELSIRSQYNERRSTSGADFVTGFILGGAVFGTLAYVFAPQIRRSLLNEDESGFRRAKQPIYYDEGLEKTRQTLNEKISQLNSAIDDVSSRLRGSNNHPLVPIDADTEEASL